MNIKINVELAENEVGLPPNILPDFQKAFIEVGQWKKEVTLRRFETEELQLPNDFFPFQLPLDLPYEKQIKGNTIKLGPVIAFLMNEKRKEYQGVKKYLRFMKHYLKVNGLIFITTMEQTNFENETMSGFFYDPRTKQFDPRERTFPFPDAVYRRGVFRKKRKHRILREKLNNHVFNAPVLDKYEQYRIFHDNKELLAHFPMTKLLRSTKTIDRMLKKYRVLYIKPVNSSLAKGIIILSKKYGKYILRSENDRKKMNKKELKAYINQLKKRRKYIVQQGVPSIEEKNIVLRTILQKNEQGQWVYSGGYARIGRRKSMITNRFHTDKFIPIEQVFHQYYRLTEEEAKEKEKYVVKLCMDICKGFDKKEVNFGDLAFDLMMDGELKGWVIEVNNKAHNLRSPLLTIKDRAMYRRVMSMPLLYAKHLSGF